MDYDQSLQAMLRFEHPADLRHFVFLWEDMSYKNGPLISPAFVREFMLPYYRELIGFFREFGDYKFLLDSDGDVRQLIPLFAEVGVDGFLPSLDHHVPSEVSWADFRYYVQQVRQLYEQSRR